MPATKQSEEVLRYWQLIADYRSKLSLVGQRYVLEVDMARFLIDATNPRVIALLTEFQQAELEKLV